MEFNRTLREVEAQIETLRAKVPMLRTHGTNQAYSSGPLVPSCRICIRQAYMSFRLGMRCNASCDFCFLQTLKANAPDDGVELRQTQWQEFERHLDRIEGVAFTGGEPLLYIDALELLIPRMRKLKPGLYVWVYTNGLLADDRTLDRLAKMRIDELRFNVAASDYDPVVIDQVGQARRRFKRVVVEVPSYPQQREPLLAALADFERVGIDQLNLQELWVTDANVARLKGEGYQSGLLFAKKFFLYGSRALTYEAMLLCTQRHYSYSVNDCSAARFGPAK
ncbi:MAG: radical SAM protein [Candidatus Alcyoniella australis]|nr:radical SAM protein [Candidatus Alcyoniella australis]